MKRFIVVLLAVVVLFTAAVPKVEARADGLVISQLAAAAYAVASSAGMDFSFTNGTSNGSRVFMENLLSAWILGQSGGLEIFGTQPLRVMALANGYALSLSYTAYNAIKDFLNDYISDNSISTTPVVVQTGTARGVTLGTWYDYYTEEPSTTNADTPFWCSVSTTGVPDEHGIYPEIRIRCGVGNQTNGITLNNYAPYKWMVEKGSSPNTWRLSARTQYYSGGVMKNNTPKFDFTITASVENTISASIPDGSMNYAALENTDLQAYKRQDWDADTNLDQMVSDIFDGVAVNDIDLTDETVADSPAEPQPTTAPEPTTAPGDIIGGLDVISGQLEGIDSTLTGVQEGVGEAVGELEGINEGVGSISEALEVPTASEAPSFKFDLTTLFPFCIPFDIYRFVTMFSASPVAPHVQIPFNIPAIGLQYTFDLDFSSFNTVASVLRSVELIAFCVGLAILTSKVIRW